MRKRWAPAVLGLTCGLTLLAYGALPARIPMRWDMQGHLKGYSDKFPGAFLLPALGVVLWLILRWLPTIDPRRANYAQCQDTYDRVVDAIVTTLAVAHLAMLGVSLGLPLPMGRLIPATVGVLFLVLGRALPRTRSNVWFGIRTPWTLSNERVWERTHRFGGYAFVGAGVLMLAAAVALPSISRYAAHLAVALSIITVAYSFIAWKQEMSR